MAKIMVETITMQEPTGRSKKRDAKNPATVDAIPTRGDATTTFRMFSENCRTVEAGLNMRA